ncbi:hypothetical protein DY000_02030809 [Brassica cretica]|uniref:Uncharacterized protein n=1 Tax=Brassica cretica TaxID=69181 RepID=A0ABQ7DKV7_BRACR|nr:hypothetical protein DY000_02030809 [Brassica cretica]
MTGGPTVYQGSGALHDGLTADLQAGLASRDLYKLATGHLKQQRVRNRVSLRMAPDACAATPRAPHGWLHDLLTCKVTPRPLPVWMHRNTSCLADPPRAPHVYLHV